MCFICISYLINLLMAKIHENEMKFYTNMVKTLSLSQLIALKRILYTTIYIVYCVLYSVYNYTHCILYCVLYSAYNYIHCILCTV